MGLSRKLLGSDEREVLHLRPHGKVLIGPVFVLLLTSAVVGVAVTLVPSDQAWGRWVAVGLGVVAVLVWFVVPLLRWLTTTFTITDHRIITRRGIITRIGHDLPLGRISDVNYRVDLLDRLFGCGTLVFTTAADDPLTLRDVPHIEQVHLTVTELLFGQENAGLDDARGNP